MRADVYMADKSAAVQRAVRAALAAGADGATVVEGFGYWRDDDGAVVSEPCTVLTIIGDGARLQAEIAARAFLQAAPGESAVLLDTVAAPAQRSRLIRREDA